MFGKFQSIIHKLLNFYISKSITWRLENLSKYKN